MDDKDNPIPAGDSVNKINTLMELANQKAARPKQQSLDLKIERQTEVNGVEMGVLSDGTPFLTGRGLALLCGVHHSVIGDLTTDWTETLQKARITAIREILASRGLSYERPYVATWQKGNATFFAYPDSVCLAILEYYAFDAGGNTKDVAVKNYRALAGHRLREFIYTQVGYDPNTNIPTQWKQFHDRMSLVYNAVPVGYFGIFKEIAEMIVTLGQSGLHIDDSFVPDISVGQHWAKHWLSNFFDLQYGERIKFDHNFPGYFPQSATNPQESWCYPESSLPEFRRWFREIYVGGGKFAAYILAKAKAKQLPVSFAQLAIEVMTPAKPKELPPEDTTPKP